MTVTLPIPSMDTSSAFLFSLFLVFVAYAEIHFKPFPLLSLFYRREPELIFDLPFMAVKTSHLPLFLLIHDAHLFPVRVKKVLWELSHQGKFITHRTVNVNRTFQDVTTFLTFKIDLNQLDEGEYELRPTCYYSINGKERYLERDNYPQLIKTPLRFYYVKEHLPARSDFLWGDLHFHSIYTSDPVEFGAPLEMTRQAAQALGLGFVAITDHSYDLDNLNGQWNKRDPRLSIWHESRKSIQQINHQNTSTPFLIPGEEVTVLNHSGRNVHLLLLNSSTYFPGDADSGEHLRGKSNTLTLSEILSEIEKSALAIAAHPRHTPPFFQKWLIRRGVWDFQQDFLPGLIGFEILNGKLESDFQDGLSNWKASLLRGGRSFIYAGNDAHGNFNLFRQVKYPFLKLHQHRKQILGECRTGIWVEKHDIPAIIGALKKGYCIISNGPYLNLSLITTDHPPSPIGSTVHSHHFKIKIRALSNFVYRKLKTVNLILGNLDEKKEIIYKTFSPRNQSYSLDLTLEEDGNLPSSGYFRLELKTEKNPVPGLAYTNPIWFKKGVEER